MRVPVLISGLAMAAGAATFAPSAEAQTVRRTGGGNLNVEFPGPCTVHYDGRGYYRYADPVCTRQQRYTADQVMRNYLRPGAGSGYPGPNYGYGQGKYRITDFRYDRIRFADDCRVYFDRLGRITNDKGGCNSGQRNYASREMTKWRRNNGYYPGGGGWYPGGQWQDLAITPTYDGGLHVRFRDKCDVYYNRYGYRIRSDDKCSRYQKARADEAVRYYGHGIRY
jgi:hypothetical protein